MSYRRKNFKSTGYPNRRRQSERLTMQASRRYQGRQEARMPAAPRVGFKETGFVDLATANYACNTTGSVTLIATIPQGAGTSERIGKKVLLKSLQCHGQLVSNTDTSLTNVGYLIVYDSRPTGNLPAITDILEDIDPGSFNNDDNASRFQVLKRVDEVLVGSTTAGLTSKSAFNQEWYMRIPKIMTFKSAATGAIGDIETGALYLVTIGGGGAGTTAGSFVASFRTRYVDM